MKLDIRLPIGFMFALVGALLAGYGLAGPGGIYQKSLGINVNLDWGLVLLAFGALMLAMGWRKTSSDRGNVKGE